MAWHNLAFQPFLALLPRCWRSVGLQERSSTAEPPMTRAGEAPVHAAAERPALVECASQGANQ